MTETPKQRARIEALEARENALIAHHTNPFVGITSSIASGVMMGSLAGVLGGGVMILATRDLSKAMNVVAKGCSILSATGIVANVGAYIYTHSHLFGGFGLGSQRPESFPASPPAGTATPAAGKN